MLVNIIVRIIVIRSIGSTIVITWGVVAHKYTKVHPGTWRAGDSLAPPTIQFDSFCVNGS